jgi:DNA-binding transcriptional LysR family regulator
MPERFGLRTLHDQLLRFHELEVDIRLESESYTALIQAVLSGRTIGLLPTVAIGRYIASGELVAIALDDPTVSRVQAKLVVRRGRRLLPAARTLLAACAEGMFPPSRHPGSPAAT